MHKRPGLKPAMEKLSVTDPAQLRALLNPVNKCLFDALDDNGGTLEELSLAIGYKAEDLMEYIHDLEELSLLESRVIDGETYYIRAANYIGVADELGTSPEGIQILQEIMVDRLADLAQDTAKMEGKDCFKKGDMNFFRFQMTAECREWFKTRFRDFLKELEERLEKEKAEVPQEEKEYYQMVFLMLPEIMNNKKGP